MKFPSTEFDRAVAAVLVGEAGEAQSRDLGELLRQNPQARQEFLWHSALHGHLLTRDAPAAEPRSLADPRTGPGPAPAPAATGHTRQRSAWPALAAGLAVASLGLAWWGASRSGPAPDYAAVLVEADGCKWAGSELPTVEGARLGPGVLALVEGIATLEFTNGATLTLEAPTTLRVLSAMRCQLVEGSVVADVPEAAHGFTVLTPGFEVIDLGTRFGVTAGDLGRAHVCVFDGEIEVRHPESGTERLTTGASLVLGGDGPGDESPDSEARHVPAPEPAASGWASVTTATGGGADAHVRRGDPLGPRGAEPMVMVKHTGLAEKNERRAYLRFDLRGLPDRSSATTAELVLEPVQSGLGFSALIPDSTFEVYGLSDDRGDSWDESTLVWDSAPAASDADIDRSRTLPVGGFAIPRAAPPGLVTVGSDGLAQLIREDGDGLVTLVLVRTSGELEKQGLVHAFASKEHPTARPPTLRVR